MSNPPNVLGATPPAGPQDIVTAIGAVGNSRTALDLSPPALALVSALDAGVGAALGLGGAVSEAAVDVVGNVAQDLVGSLSEALGGTIAEIVGDVAAAIPIVGPVIKAVTSIITFGLSAGESSAAACSRLFTTFKPPQTGSLLAGGLTVPADIFARTHGIERWYTQDPSDYADVRKDLSRFHREFQDRRFLPAGPLDCRSALGMAMMQITEGCIADLRDFNWLLTSLICLDVADDDEHKHLADPKVVRVRWWNAIHRDATIAPAQWGKVRPWEPKRGLPRGWRDRFRRLRRGIEASWGPELSKSATSDGGAALWVAYLDLLTRAFEPKIGHLTWEYVEFLFARQRRFADKKYPFRGAGDHTWHRLVEPLLQKRRAREYTDDTALVAAPPTWIWGDDPCPRMVTQNLRSLVESWQHTMNPYYQQGQAKVAKLVGEAREIGRAAGARRAVRRRPPRSTKKSAQAPHSSVRPHS